MPPLLRLPYYLLPRSSPSRNAASRSSHSCCSCFTICLMTHREPRMDPIAVRVAEIYSHSTLRVTCVTHVTSLLRVQVCRVAVARVGAWLGVVPPSCGLRPLVC